MDIARVARRFDGGWGTRRSVAAIGCRHFTQRLAPFCMAEREAIEAEAISLPLPGLNGPITVRWS